MTNCAEAFQPGLALPARGGCKSCPVTCGGHSAPAPSKAALPLGPGPPAPVAGRDMTSHLPVPSRPVYRALISHAHTHAHMRTRTHMHRHMCERMCTHTCTHMHAQGRTHAHAHTCARTHKLAHMHTRAAISPMKKGRGATLGPPAPSSPRGLSPCLQGECTGQAPWATSVLSSPWLVGAPGRPA